MSRILTPQDGTASAPLSAGIQVLQKIGVLGAKAALNSIPWAALVFDLGQLGIDYGNARLMDRLLNGLGERIDHLENDARRRLGADDIYQLSAQAAIRRMLTETNPRMADALARAVVELGNSTLSPTERMEIARALDALTEPGLHLLQTFYRVQHNLLTERELEVFEGNMEKPLQFTALMYASMTLTTWIAPASDLERAGMVVATLDDGGFDGDSEASEANTHYPVYPRQIYPVGERVVGMCFDDPSVPAFGAFAIPPEVKDGAIG